MDEITDDWIIDRSAQDVQLWDEGNVKVWEGTMAEYGELLELIQNREPVPWCEVHDCCIMSGYNDCHFSLHWSTDYDCKIEDPPTHWRTNAP